MAKNKQHIDRLSGPQYLVRTKNLLREKYFNMWVKKYQFEGDEIDWRKNKFILKSYYYEGKILACKAPVENTLQFAPFTTFSWDLYDTPVQVQVINKRGSALLPNELLFVNENAVISYILPSTGTISESVEWYIDRIALTELIMRTNLYVHSIPFFTAVSPSDKAKIKEIMNEVLDGELVIGGDFVDLERIKTILTGAPYILDKLQKYKTDKENELKTFLGINNTGVEKQERLLVDEVNANNEEIDTSKDMFLSQMEEFCTNINKYLGFNISVKSIETEPVEEVQETKEGDQDDDNQ